MGLGLVAVLDGVVGAGALGGVDVVAGQLVLVNRDLEQVRLVRGRGRVDLVGRDDGQLAVPRPDGIVQPRLEDGSKYAGKWLCSLLVV